MSDRVIYTCDLSLQQQNYFAIIKAEQSRFRFAKFTKKYFTYIHSTDVKTFNSLLNDITSKSKGLTDDRLTDDTKIGQKLKFVFGRVENIMGRKSFFPFPSIFSKTLF